MKENKIRTNYSEKRYHLAIIFLIISLFPNGSDGKSYNKQQWMDCELFKTVNLELRHEILQDAVNEFSGKNKHEVINV